MCGSGVEIVDDGGLAVSVDWHPMVARRQVPTRLRPGKRAWLGPAALAVGVVSWLVPAFGAPVAAAAVVCAVVSAGTDRQYRLDWMAVAGGGLGLGQVLVALLVVGL